jgi:hypothetical protein
MTCDERWEIDVVRARRTETDPRLSGGTVFNALLM